MSDFQENKSKPLPVIAFRRKGFTFLPGSAAALPAGDAFSEALCGSVDSLSPLCSHDGVFTHPSLLLPTSHALHVMGAFRGGGVVVVQRPEQRHPEFTGRLAQCSVTTHCVELSRNKARDRDG